VLLNLCCLRMTVPYMAKILLVEDDLRVAEALEDWLTEDSHTVEVVHNGADALDRLRFYQHELIILDWDLPDMSGIEICRQFRATGGQLPVMMLTAKGSGEHHEMGLDSGADEYVTKPFDPRELSARIRALLRRKPQVDAVVLKAGVLELDPRGGRVTRAGKEVHLQKKELALLEFFMRHPGEIFSPDALLDRVWKSESEASHDAVRMQIKSLRSKIDSEGEESYIKTVHRVGYKFQPPLS
jgi:two-component system, OmpR family, manganese sensing response regulator